jgi:hypothetical protein
MIAENPHCQYFISMEELLDRVPFDASKMTAFWKRFLPEALAEINEAIIATQKKDPPLPAGNGDDDGSDHNDGTLSWTRPARRLTFIFRRMPAF